MSLLVDRVTLRDVANPGVAPARRFAEDGEPATRRLVKAQQHPEERRLPGSVRADDGDEFPGLDIEARVFPDDLVSVPDLDLLSTDCGRTRPGTAPPRGMSGEGQGRASSGHALSLSQLVGIQRVLETVVLAIHPVLEARIRRLDRLAHVSESHVVLLRERFDGTT